MLDFNDAEKQKPRVGAIPPDSCVVFQVSITTPKNPASHPMLGASSKGNGNEVLGLKLTVFDGTFKGKDIYEYLTVIGNETAVNISKRTLRAMVESARNVLPTDQSPSAIESRRLSDWSDLDGMLFMARVSCKLEQSKIDGRWYPQNDVKLVITPDMKEYPILAEKMEIITDNPIPTKEDDAKTAGPAAPWVTPKTVASTTAPAPTTGATPAWLRPKA